MESDDALRKQLIFQAEIRSMAEMERILSRFLREHLPLLSDEACQRLLRLLQCSDLDLLAWLSGLQEPPTEVDREALGWIASTHIFKK